MKVISNQQLSNGIGLSILELDHPLILTSFEDRFQVMIEVGGNRLLPKDKKKFLNFKINDHLYILKSKQHSEDIHVTPELFYEKKICDKTWDDCIKIIIDYIGMYNDGENLKREIAKEFTMISYKTYQE